MLGGMAVFAFSNGENDIGAFPDYSFFVISFCFSSLML